jgi:branched-subunit amino acid transport protein
LKKLAAIGAFILALAPSAYLAYSLRGMPHLGFYHDDSIYWTSAKSLASGNGYRIASLPGEPYQTKYPPLYPALLAGIWKFNPDFPGNMPAATLLAWSLLPVYLGMVWLLLRQYGFAGWRRLALLLMATLSPATAVFSFSLMPELLFTALLLASLMLAERALDPKASRWLPLLAGLCGALAYLTKSAAAPLIVTVPAYFLWRRQLRSAALFLTAMLPAAVAWQWWVSGHLSRSWDLVTLYYTNYVGFQIYNVSLRDLPLVAWHNLDTFLMGAGKLLTFDVPYGSMHLERLVAVGAIAGCVRLARRTQLLQYPLAALGMAALMLIWHYTPDQRFVFPLYPLLLIGLWTELENLCGMLRLSWRKPAFADRAAAMAGAGLVATFAAFVLFTTFFGLFRFLPGLFDAYRADLEARRPAYAWIARNTPRAASVFAYDDPLLYLYTGRKSLSLPIPPKLQHHDDQAGIDQLLDSIPDFASRHGATYALVTPGDFYRDLHAHGALREAAAIRTLNPAFTSPAALVYEFPAARAVASAR